MYIPTGKLLILVALSSLLVPIPFPPHSHFVWSYPNSPLLSVSPFLLLCVYILYISYTVIVHITTFLIRTITSSWMLSIGKVSHSYMMTFNSAKDNIKELSLKYKLLSLKSMHGKLSHTLHFTHVQYTPNTHSTHYIDSHTHTQHTHSTYTHSTQTHSHTYIIHVHQIPYIFLIRFSGILWFTFISFPTDFGITKTHLWFVYLSCYYYCEKKFDPLG